MSKSHAGSTPRFNDDMIRRGDLPADAFALIHDLAYHHDGRDVQGYVTAAQEILKQPTHAEGRIIGDMLKALRQIEQGAGPYSRDPLQHAANVIEESKEIARDAIEQATKTLPVSAGDSPNVSSVSPKESSSPPSSVEMVSSTKEYAT